MRTREDFPVESWSDRPWAVVWDPQGFREPGCETGPGNCRDSVFGGRVHPLLHEPHR